MAEATGNPATGLVWARWIGRVLVLLWALFLVILWIREGIPDIKAHTWSGMFLVFLILTVVAIVMVFIAWNYNVVGGILLILEAIAGTVIYYTSQSLLPHAGTCTYVCMASLPFLAGIFFILGRPTGKAVKPAGG